MTQLHSFFTKMFNLSRKHATVEIFQVIVYIFVPWAELKPMEVESESVEMTWMSSTGDLATAADIPVDVSFAQRDGMMGQKNEDAYKRYASERSNVMMIVEHDVLVRRGGSTNELRNNVGDEVRTWRWAVSPRDVAAYFHRAICGFERTTRVYDILARHLRSMYALYLVSKKLRVLLSNREGIVVNKPGTEDEKSTQENHGTRSLSRDEMVISDMIFEMLTPSGGRQGRPLVRATYSVPEEIYNERHLPEELPVSECEDVHRDCGISTDCAVADGSVEEDSVDLAEEFDL